MAGLPWFEHDVDLSDDPKVAALATRLREPLAEAYVTRLYAYCYKHVEDRFDADVAVEIIEKTAAKWRGRRNGLFDALFRCGFLEREAGKVVVHGVKARLGPHIAKRTADRERQRCRRDKAERSIGQPSDVAATSPLQPSDVRYDKDRDIDKDKEEKKPAPGRPAPRQKLLTDMLVAVFREKVGKRYAWQGAKDGRAAVRLYSAAGGDLAEIERRWRLALSDKFKGAHSVAGFASLWNNYAVKADPYDEQLRKLQEEAHRECEPTDSRNGTTAQAGTEESLGSRGGDGTPGPGAGAAPPRDAEARAPLPASLESLLDPRGQTRRLQDGDSGELATQLGDLRPAVLDGLTGHAAPTGGPHGAGAIQRP